MPGVVSVGGVASWVHDVVVAAADVSAAWAVPGRPRAPAASATAAPPSSFFLVITAWSFLSGDCLLLLMGECLLRLLPACFDSEIAGSFFFFVIFVKNYGPSARPLGQ